MRPVRYTHHRLHKALARSSDSKSLLTTATIPHLHQTHRTSQLWKGLNGMNNSRPRPSVCSKLRACHWQRRSSIKLFSPSVTSYLRLSLVSTSEKFKSPQMGLENNLRKIEITPVLGAISRVNIRTSLSFSPASWSWSRCRCTAGAWPLEFLAFLYKLKHLRLSHSSLLLFSTYVDFELTYSCPMIASCLSLTVLCCHVSFFFFSISFFSFWRCLIFVQRFIFNSACSALYMHIQLTPSSLMILHLWILVLLYLPFLELCLGYLLYIYITFLLNLDS